MLFVECRFNKTKLKKLHVLVKQLLELEET